MHPPWLALFRVIRFFNNAESGTEIKPLLKMRELGAVFAASVLPGIGLVLILFIQCMWWGFPGIWLFAGRNHYRCWDQNTTDCCINISNFCWPPERVFPCAADEVCTPCAQMPLDPYVQLRQVVSFPFGAGPSFGFCSSVAVPEVPHVGRG